MIRLRKKPKPEPTGKRSYSLSQRLTVVILTFLMLVIPVVIYFTRYISNQTSYFTNQNFRELAAVGEQVEGQIVQLASVFGRRVVYKAKFGSASPPLKEMLEGTGFSVVKDSPYKTPPNSDATFDRNKIKMQINPGGEDSAIVLTYDLVPNKESEQSAVEIYLSKIVGPLVGKRIAESARGSEHEQGFDSVLIAKIEDPKNAAGNSDPSHRSIVIFQSRSPELDIDSLDNLIRSDAPDKTLDLQTLKDITAAADVRIGDVDYKMYSQPVELPIATVGQTGNESRWIVCGLVQASHFRHQTWAFPYTVLITFAFVTVIVALSWPLLKLIFIGPKDRLRLADVYFIAFAMLVGSATLTFFMLFALVYSRTESQLDDQLKKLSQTIVGYTDEDVFHPGNFQTEITRINEQIDGLNKLERWPKVIKEIATAEAKRDAASRKKALAGIPSFRKQNILKRTGKSPELAAWLVGEAPYPFFQRATWTDKAGNMRAVWHISTDVTPLESDLIRQRDWFTRVMQDKHRDLDREKLWLEPVTSRYHGDKTVVVSKAISEPDHPENIVGVVAVGPSLISLMHTVLPAGFGYRVIDASGNDPGDENNNDPGKVLFQSSESQQLKENFFHECDNNHSLRSLVFGRATGWVDVNYKGEGHRLYVAPIKGFPNWSLIVFRNKQPLRTVFLETLTLAGFLFFIYAAILLIVFTIVYVIKVRTDERTDWIWPSDEMAPHYRQALAVNVLLCVLGIAVIVLPLYSRLPPAVSVASINLLAFAGILAVALKLKIGSLLNKVPWTVRWLNSGGGLLNSARAYTWNMVVLLILTAILPAIVFFKVAYNEEIKLFIKHAQFTVAEGLEQRAAEIDSQYSTQSADAASNPRPLDDVDDARKIIARRAGDPLRLKDLVQEPRLDLYTNFFFGMSVVPSKDQPQQSPDTDSVLAFLNSFVPFFNETSIEMGGLTHGRSGDNSYRWEEDETNLAFHSTHISSELSSFGDQAGYQTHIITPIQRLTLPSPFSSRANFLFVFAWAAGFAIILALMWWLVRLVVNKVFLLDISQQLCPLIIPEPEPKESLFVVRHLPVATENSILSDGQFLHLDASTDSRALDWIAQNVNQTSCDKIIISNFEHSVHDSVINRRKLQLIEALLAAKKLVVILSTIEPAAYSLLPQSTTQGPHENGFDETNARWARVFSRFKKVYSATRPNTVSENSLSSLEAAFDANTLSKDNRDRVLEIAAQVYEECANLPCLHELSSDIIAHLPFEDSLEWNMIRRQIADRAELYYRQIWHQCSDGERLTLLHLAEDRLLSPNDPDIASLLRKRLIVFTPDLQLTNETFKLFLLSRTATDDLQVKESQARSASRWEAFKIPLLIGVIAVISFFIFTQKDLYSSSWTLITAMTTGIPAVFKVISLFQTGASEKNFSA